MFAFKRPLPATELALQRKKQVDSLIGHVPNVKVADANRSVLDVPILLPTSVTLYLRITLPNGFPQDAPTVQIIMPATGVEHAWLDKTQCVIGHDKLRSWNLNADLGKVVQEIVREFCVRPPRITAHQSGAAAAGGSSAAGRTTAPAPVSAAPTQPSSAATQPSNAVAGPTIPPKPAKTALPPVPTQFPQLLNMTAAEIEFLMSDQNAFDKFVEEQEAVYGLVRVRDDVLAKMPDLAETNKRLEEELAPLQVAVATLHEQTRDRKAELDVAVARQQSIVQRVSLAGLLAKLGEAAEAADRECEETAAEFVRGDMDIKDFLNRFLDQRKVYHKRMARKEWNQMAAASNRPL